MRAPAASGASLFKGRLPDDQPATQIITGCMIPYRMFLNIYEF